jgi:ATP-dependent exoDNAse (exonuclease V) alpha subunit
LRGCIQIDALWEHFTVISLVENHRQQGDAEYANILNRIRLGEHTNDDMKVLQERVRPEGHPDLSGAQVIASTHAIVNKHNALSLEKLNTELIQIEAINSHNNIPNYQPKIHPKKHTVGITSYLQTLCIKVGCRVMLTFNLDVKDSLSNGSIGTLKGVLKNPTGEVKVLMVQFDNKDSGREMRRCHPQYTSQFPNCTPIMKQAHKYTTSKSSGGVKSNIATVFQFPLILSFASTTHKIQGQTIVKPKKAAVDLQSVFGSNQAYVMLGRVQERSQLFIIDSLPVHKITTDKDALDQLGILKAKSINSNPPVWEKSYDRSSKVCTLNISSLRDKIEDVKGDQILTDGDAIVLSESWLDPESSEEDPSLQLHGYKLHLNSYGRGKGLAVYYKENKFTPTLKHIVFDRL